MYDLTIQYLWEVCAEAEDTVEHHAYATVYVGCEKLQPKITLTHCM